MKINRIKVGVLKCNCYILSIDNDVIVIDPGDDASLIAHEIIGKNVLAVLITHNHFDHIGAINLFDKNIVYSYYNLKEKEYQFNKFIFKVIKTPGHSDDMLSYYFYEDSAIFTGDFLFKETIGRTDLDTSSKLDMINSLNKIKTIENDAILYPGHGINSTLQTEIKNIDQYISLLCD